MKIAIEISALGANHKSGVSYYTIGLINALKASGADVVGFGFDFNNRSNLKRKVTELLGDNIKLRINTTFPQRIYHKLNKHGFAPPVDVLCLFRADAVIYPAYILWPTLLIRRRLPIIYDLGFIKHPEFMEDHYRELLIKTMPKTVSRASRVITISSTMESEIVDQYQIEKNKIIVTPIPPSTSEYNLTRIKDFNSLSRYNIKKPYILFVGNIEPRKNIAELVEAYSHLSEKLRTTNSLVIAGGPGWKNDDLMQKINSLAADMGLDIIMTGYYDQSDAATIYGRASVFVFPSKYEGFGMPILEAMACGTPVICSDIAVSKEVAGQAAVFYKLGDPAELAHKIEEVLTNSELRKSLKKKGQVNLVRYSWAENIRNLTSSLEKL